MATPASTAQAMAMALDGLRYLATADHGALATQAQADCLLGLERAAAMSTAARAGLLGAFAASRGYCADGDYSITGWLINRGKMTKAAAREQVRWARRAAAHPLVMAALAEGGVLGGSLAKLVCAWSDRLPADCRDAADDILVAAARAGADRPDLAALAAEIYTRSLPDPPGDEGGNLGLDFEDRRVRVETTFGGAGIIAGDLTAECAAVVAAVLESLSAPADADDTRSKDQRFHDGLFEAMRRLVASGLLPQRAGQPVRIWGYLTLAELRALDDGSVLADQWVGEMAARWAANRAAASEGGGDGGAWLEGPAARAMACDATIIPVVTGDVDPGALDDLVRLCVQLDRHEHPASAPAAPSQAAADPAVPDTDPACDPVAPDVPGPAAPDGSVAVPDGLLSREALRKAIIGEAVDLLSGPGGLASFLRTRQLGDIRLAGPSLPLDIGWSATIPPAIRNAVILRDRRCRWPGGCNQPAAACQVHHVKHKAHGGPTSLADCVLLCSYHHQVVIHRWGWTLVLNPDGTTTTWNPDRTKILHSHSPPARAG